MVVDEDLINESELLMKVNYQS